MRDLADLCGMWLVGCALTVAVVHKYGQPLPEARMLRSLYASVGAEHPDVRWATEAANLAEARRGVGRQGAFTGTVTSFYAAPDGSVRLLNFHSDYRRAIVAAVKPLNFARLGGEPGLECLVGQHVLVRGRVFLFKGRPELELASPRQLKLVR